MRKNKIISSIIILLLIWTSVAFAGTVSNNDNQTTSSDSDIIIDYDDSFCKFHNGTYDYLEVDNNTINNDVINTLMGEDIFNNSKASTIDNDMMLGWNASNATRIQNSNGKSWTATGANIQLAIDDLNTSTETGGTVWCPSGDTIVVSDSIQLYYNMTLDLRDCNIEADDDFDIILMYPRSTLKNGIINATQVASFSNTTACIKFLNPTSMDPYIEGFDFPRSRYINNVKCISKQSRGIGLLLYPATITGKPNDFGLNCVENMKFFFLNTSIKLKCDYNYNYVNFNRFTTIAANSCSRVIWLDCTGNEISGNTFTGVKYESESIPSQKEVIWMTGKCNNNYVYDFQTMDWDSDTDGVTIKLEGATVHNSPANGGNYEYFMPSGCIFEGDVDKEKYGHANYIYDESADAPYNFHYNNTFRGKKSITLNSINLSNCIGYNKGMNPNHNSDTGISLYQKTTENPWTYIFGDESGADHYLAFRVDSAGNGDFITESGDMEFAPSTKIVNINDCLDIVPQAGAPAGVAGRIYYESNNNTLCCYNGNEWKAMY